jgi:anti-sigma-K factor RskA
MNGHPNREEDFDLYALGALDGDEKQAIESHIAACPQCAAKLAEARGRLAMMSFAAPRMDPSPQVKDHLIKQVHAEARDSARQYAPRAVAATPPARGLFGRWWAAALAPIGVALAVATVFLWNQNERLDRELASLRQTIAEQQKNLEETRHAAEMLAAHDTIVVPLAPMPGMPKGSIARVTYNQHMGMLMYDGNLGPAPANKSYQLWLVPMKGDPINAGVFNPKAGQTDHWMMHLPVGVEAKAFAITIEPAGGMPHPTGPKVLTGAVS